MTSTQKRRFLRQGFLVIHKILSEVELLQARGMVSNLVERHRSSDEAVVSAGISIGSVTSQHPQRNPGVVADQWQREPYIIGDLIALDTLFATLFSAQTLWQCAANLLGCSQELVVFHFCNITRKPPFNGPAVGLHYDANNTYFASSDRRTVRLLLPLQPMSEANGGTEIVVGSHLPSAAPNAPVHCPQILPGSVLALHSEVLHGGTPNRSAYERDVIVIQFGVATSELLYQSDEMLALSTREEMVRFSHKSRG